MKSLPVVGPVGWGPGRGARDGVPVRARRGRCGPPSARRPSACAWDPPSFRRLPIQSWMALVEMVRLLVAVSVNVSGELSSVDLPQDDGPLPAFIEQIRSCAYTARLLLSSHRLEPEGRRPAMEPEAKLAAEDRVTREVAGGFRT